MSKFLLKTLSIAVCLAWSGSAAALGIGGINVTSALGQPLKADIELVSITKAEKASLVARLASPDTYKNSGADYPYNNKYRFELVNRPDGSSYLKVTTDQPVQDPFVVMMVEVNWAAGRLVREFTFLLDPPNYAPDQPATAVEPVVPVAPTAAEPVANQPVSAPAVEPVEAVPAPVEPVPAAAEPVAQQPAAQPELASEPAPVVQSKPAATAAESAAPKGRFDIAPASPAKTVAAAKPAADSYVVQRGDTLNSIAKDNMPGSVSLERALVALYRANASQFDGQNMNRLSVGKKLHLPSTQEVNAITQSEAVTEIRAQADNWNAYRQKLASAAAPSSGEAKATQQVATGKISSSVADKTPVAKESAQEVLKLSKGEMPSDKAVTTTSGKKSPTAQEQKNAAQENAIAADKAAKEAQTRTALLEKNLKDMEKLAQLKLEAAALAQKPASPAPAVPAATPAVPVVAAPAASAVVAAKPKPVVQAAKAPVPEPLLLDTILSEPTYLAGGGAGLLGLLGLGWMVARRRKAEPAFEDMGDVTQDIGAKTGSHMAMPVPPSPDTGDFTGSADKVGQVATHAEEDVDPISEADLFLSFGRDLQAEEILKEALNRTPDNHQIHARLLGIYANRKDKEAFENIARQLKDSGDEAAFAQACQMGRGIDPSNALYGKPIPIEDASSATMQAPAFANQVTQAATAVSKPDVDFDVGAVTASSQRADADTQKTMSMSATETREELPNLDDLIFDVTGSHPTLQMEKPAAPPAQEPEGISFTLDVPTAEEKPKAPVIDFASVSLNLDDSAPQPDNKGEQWQEVATKLDLAKAYQEMGDAAGAREILEEVLREGDTTQRLAAQELLALVA